MSLTDRQQKYRQEVIKKKFTITATQEDMKALHAVIKETERMFNTDLDDDGDLTSRITISPSIDPEPTMYPRTAAYLRQLTNKLNVAATTTQTDHKLHVPQIPILTKRGVQRDKILGVMENVLHGSLKNKGGLSRRPRTSYNDLVIALDAMIRNRALEDVLTDSGLQWAYVQNLETHLGSGMTDKEKKSFEKMLKADKAKKDYPADFGEYSQAYIAMLRSDNVISFDIPTNIDRKDWDDFLVNFDAASGQIDSRFNKPPKTMGELLEFIFAYSVGKTVRMDDATTTPFGSNRHPLESEIIHGTGGATGGNPDEVDGRKHLYKTIVVGTGPVRMQSAMAPRGGSISEMGMGDVPGFTM